MYACSCSFSYMLKFLCSMTCNDSARFVFCRPISDVSSDLTIEVGASTFALHKVKETSCHSDKRLYIQHGFLRCSWILGIFLSWSLLLFCHQTCITNNLILLVVWLINLCIISTFEENFMPNLSPLALMADKW